jgi:dTMP kinase
MTVLIAIEGADGVGKNTAAQNVAAALCATGIRAAMISFPRYASTIGGMALGKFLSGRLAVPVTPSSLAVLYALDRFESLNDITSAASSHDVVIFDRYIASNVAYQAAKVGEAVRLDLMQWIVKLETDTFHLPLPTLNIYLDTPLAVARQLMMLKRRRSYTERHLDEHEADMHLQERVRRTYEYMAEHALVGPWHTLRTVRGERLMEPDAITREIVTLIHEIGWPFDDRQASIRANA